MVLYMVGTGACESTGYTHGCNYGCSRLFLERVGTDLFRDFASSCIPLRSTADTGSNDRRAAS